MIRQILIISFISLVPRLVSDVVAASAAVFPEKVALQLKWRHQFQFAGYYAALKQGYYREEGLEVEIREGAPNISSVDNLLTGKNQYGIGSADALLARMKGKPVVALAVIFQHSPLIYLTRTQDIRTPSDLIGHTIMIGNDGDLQPLQAVFLKENLPFDKVRIVGHSWNIEDLLAGKTDAMSAYSTELHPALVQKRAPKIGVIQPENYGIDFYGDTLITTEDEIKRHPQRVAAFLRASLKGWEYAFRHQQELIEQILGMEGVRRNNMTREQLTHEAMVMERLIQPNLLEIGHINPGRWQHMADVFAALGIHKGPYSLEGFIYDPKREPLWKKHLPLVAWLTLALISAVVIWNSQLRMLVRRRTVELTTTLDELSRQKNLISCVVNGTQDAIFVKDAAGRYLMVNHEVERLFGKPQEEIIGKDDTDFFPPDEARALMAGDLEIMAMFEPLTREENLTTPDGERTYLATKGSIHDEQGHVIGLFGISRDITVRKLAEDKLRLSEEKFSTAFRTSPDAIKITRMSDGMYLEINEGFTLVSGYTSEEVIGRTSKDLDIWVTPEDRERFVRELGASGIVNNLEAQFRRKDGTIICGLMSARPIDVEGVPCILSITRDITGLKEAEAEKQVLMEQLGQSQKMESIGRLAGGVAHDFNNLLTPIMINAELLRQNMTPGSREFARADGIVQATDKARILTQQLLGFGRKHVLEMQTIDMNEVITSFYEILRSTIRENIDIQLHLSQEGYGIRADRNQLEQIIMNLAVNAQDAIGDKGVIAIETVPVTLDDEYVRQHAGVAPGRYLMLVVSDTGSGMDQETRSRIFEPFFTTKGVGKGTGLGLATVYGLVKQHGGSIWVYTEIGIGTAFKLYFPIIDETPPVRQAPETEQLAFDSKGKTILLVEDNDMVRTLVYDLLLTLGCNVLVADKPKTAFDMCNGKHLDLLLTDVVMPEMNGPELHQRLLKTHQGLKVLYMSGYTGSAISHHGVLEEGINFMQKPFTITDLTRKIETLLKTPTNRQ